MATCKGLMKAFQIALIVAFIACATVRAAETKFPDVSVSGHPNESNFELRYSLIGYANPTGDGWSCRKLLEAYAGQSGQERHAGVVARWMNYDMSLTQVFVNGFRERAEAVTETDSRLAKVFNDAADAMAAQGKDIAVRVDAQKKVAAALLLMPKASKPIAQKEVSISGITTLMAAKQAAVSALKKSSVELRLSDRTDRHADLTLIELMGHAGDRSSEWHMRALKELRKNAPLPKILAQFRANVAALPETVETRACIAQVIDPVIKGLSAPANDEIVGALSRLKASLLEVKSGS
jgi:hypothetical protein